MHFEDDDGCWHRIVSCDELVRLTLWLIRRAIMEVVENPSSTELVAKTTAQTIQSLAIMMFVGAK